MLEITKRLSIPLRELNFSFSRSQGPGGQNVNKTASKAELRWNVKTSKSISERIRDRFMAQNRNKITSDGIFVLTSQRFRDQGRNIADCLEKLKELLVISTKIPKARKATKPSRRSVEKRIESKKKNSEKKKRRRPLKTSQDY